MNLKKLCVSALLLALASPALADQGEVCSSKPLSQISTLTNDTVFECKTAGSVTIPELYASGWKVISIFSQSSALTNATSGLPQASYVWTVVVERE
jgi:hypothetical protein